MVVREPMNYSLEITKSLVPKHLKSLGYSELKRSYSTDTILNIDGRWYSTKAIGEAKPNYNGKILSDTLRDRPFGEYPQSSLGSKEP